MAERLLKVAEVAERLGVAKSTVYELMYRGELPSQTVGATKTRRVRESALDDWIRSTGSAPIAAGR